MASAVPCFFIATLAVALANQNYRSNGFVDKLRSGMKFAHEFLGSESVALKVADFVVRTFNTANNPNTIPKRHPQPLSNVYADNIFESDESFSQDKTPNSNTYQGTNQISPWRHLIRLFGLQPNQISAVAVNALVFVAQLISTFLTGSKRSTISHKNEDPTHWILNKESKKLQDIITTAKNESLSDMIENLIKEQDMGEETSCIKLLVCKITPLVIKMQSAVFGKDNQTHDSGTSEYQGAGILYRHLPSSEEIYTRSDYCEKRYKECDLNEY